MFAMAFSVNALRMLLRAFLSVRFTPTIFALLHALLEGFNIINLHKDDFCISNAVIPIITYNSYLGNLNILMLMLCNKNLNK
uniref:Secreted protein n=1 Tax=Heterorhabditis bacteriophora TaxID=37862 RepID=A0A1I7X819_HETBA